MGEEAKIKIFDEEYNLRINSEGGRERLEQVAAYVDEKMRIIASSNAGLAPKQVAVLAALQFSEDLLFGSQGVNGNGEKGVKKENLMVLTNRIEDALSGG